MKSRVGLILAVVVVVVGIAGFLAGLQAGAGGAIGIHVRASIGDGYAGDQVATLWIGDTAYGVRDSVPWRDASGSEHDGGWPQCLAAGQLSNVRFIGAMVWHDPGGADGTILWVDCSIH